MILKIIHAKIFKFIVGGGVAASLNLLLMILLIEWLGFNSPSLRAIANAISIEVSLLASFFIYRIWVWTGGVWTVKELLLRQISLYHFSAGVAVISRIFFLFPLLDRLEVNYTINTLVGVITSAVLNYLISDRLVFKTTDSEERSIDIILLSLLGGGFERLAFFFLQSDSANYREDPPLTASLNNP